MAKASVDYNTRTRLIFYISFNKISAGRKNSTLYAVFIVINKIFVNHDFKTSQHSIL